MRAIVQRVCRASVDVGDERVAEIGQGLLVFVGVGHRDTEKDAISLARKIVGLRIFEDAEGKMNLGLAETEGSLCLVSQFTLWADARKGRRPSFGEAAPPEVAEPLFEQVVTEAKSLAVPVVTGRFRKNMQVELVNDGPITIMLDTERTF